jgi:hypothetical protein
MRTSEPSVPPALSGADSDVDRMVRGLIEQPVAPLPAAEADALRARVTARLASQQREVSARRAAWERRQPWLVFAVAALLPLVVWGASRAVRSGERRAGLALVTDLAGTSTIAGDELSTGPDASSRASLPSGARVDVGPSARVRFDHVADQPVTGDRIDLAAGAIEVQVPKLAPGTDLRVRTADAVVVVHGTRFTVERVAPPGGRVETRVSVTEGLVEVDGVEGPRMLAAGMTLVVPAAHDAMVPPPSAPPASAASEPPSRTTGLDPTPSATSTLAAENALLADAMRLRREHHAERALARLDELLARYPSSPLVPTVRAERQRVVDELANAAGTHLP